MIKNLFFVVLMIPILTTSVGCDKLRELSPSARISDEELIEKRASCFSNPQSSPTTVMQCENYERECKRRNKKYGRHLC